LVLLAPANASSRRAFPLNKRRGLGTNSTVVRLNDLGRRSRPRSAGQRQDHREAILSSIPSAPVAVEEINPLALGTVVSRGVGIGE
jgi:hypothetical protein